MNNLLLVNQLGGIELTTGAIHVWFASLEQPAARFQGLLSIEERMRAERFRFDDSRRRFIIRRGMLRALLGRYLGAEPSRLQFWEGKNGKPALAEESGGGKIRFNSSHSEERAVYAFTRDCEVGVDIEHVRDIPDMEQIAERFFSAREKAAFRELPESEQKEAFFHCWTRKEAFIKAVGDGLSWSLDQFDVSPVPGEPVRNLTVKEESINGSQWFVYDLEIDRGYQAALATEGQSFEPVCFNWQS
jgi:4'-phosphopantetheinyl transferase